MSGDGWRRVRVASVDVEVPEEMSAEAGVEGGAVTLAGPQVRLILDESPFADPLTAYESKPEFTRRREEIGGEDAELVSFRADDGTRVSAVRLADRLTAVTHTSPETDREVPLRILRSIRPIRDEE